MPWGNARAEPWFRRRAGRSRGRLSLAQSPYFTAGAYRRLTSRDSRGPDRAMAKPKRAQRLPLKEPIMRPTFRRERRALNSDIFPVAGCDEAGRGPLAPERRAHDRFLERQALGAFRLGHGAIRAPRVTACQSPIG